MTIPIHTWYRLYCGASRHRTAPRHSLAVPAGRRWGEEEVIRTPFPRPSGYPPTSWPRAGADFITLDGITLDGKEVAIFTSREPKMRWRAESGRAPGRIGVMFICEFAA
jgi:hypothetical protein